MGQHEPEGSRSMTATAGSSPERDAAATEEDDALELFCLRCEVPALKVAWSAAAGQFIHLRRLRRGDVASEICGGKVVPREELHAARLEAGHIHVCYPAGPNTSAHLVRLGRLANRRNDSWTGTAVCGFVPRGSRHWLPIPPHVAATL